MTMTLQQFRYFLTLSEEQNFTRAAERCGIKQPTLTRAIKELEAEFGGPLFVRGWKATRLSGLGMVVRPHIADIDRSAATARRKAADFLAAPPALATTPQEKSMRKITYAASIAATILLIAGATVHFLQPLGASPAAPAAAVVDVYALESKIDVDALPRYDIPAEAEE